MTEGQEQREKRLDQRKLVETKAWSRRKEATEIKNPEPAGHGGGIAAKWNEAGTSLDSRL